MESYDETTYRWPTLETMDSCVLESIITTARRDTFFTMKGATVWAAFYDVLRAYNMTTIFGNPGSTGKTKDCNDVSGKRADVSFLSS